MSASGGNGSPRGRSSNSPANHTTTWEAVERFLAQPGVDYPIAHPHLRLDTTRPLDELVSQLLAWLDAWEGDRVSYMEDVLGGRTDATRFQAFLDDWEAILARRVDEALAVFRTVEGLHGLVLAGSAGRGEPWPLSDIDLLPIYADDALD